MIPWRGYQPRRRRRRRCLAPPPTGLAWTYQVPGVASVHRLGTSRRSWYLSSSPCKYRTVRRHTSLGSARTARPSVSAGSVQKRVAQKRAPAVMTPDQKSEGSQATRALGFIVVVVGPDQRGSIEIISTTFGIIFVSMRKGRFRVRGRCLRACPSAECHELPEQLALVHRGNRDHLESHVNHDSRPLPV